MREIMQKFINVFLIEHEYIIQKIIQIYNLNLKVFTRRNYLLIIIGFASKADNRKTQTMKFVEAIISLAYVLCYKMQNQ